ncbi:MAG: histidinol-phosphate transaminase [Clostridiales bacterium]|mgnify:CR=1 FL=1|nr:histidinol-phosphate transaminase [Clostridiales bacterium]
MKLWENNIRKVEPYVPGEQPQEKGIIKLNTNENPYPPAPSVAEVLNKDMTDRLRLYPDPKITSLVNAIAEDQGLDPSQVFVGVGSDDVIALSYLTFFNSDKPILFPDITYSFYDVWANLFRIPYKQVALDENFRIRKEDYNVENGGIIIANPNAPTSIYEELDVIRYILDNNKESIVIIDEAYIDFAGKSAKELINDYENLLVVQTFSKSRSMAGMRIGYAMGSANLIKALNDVKYSFNSYTLNLPSILCGVEAIKDKEYFNKTVEKIKLTRDKTMKDLKMLGFSFPSSMTNFIFAKHEDISGLKIYEELRKRKIYVRHFNKAKIMDYVRITIGTDEEMEVLIQSLKDIIG